MGHFIVLLFMLTESIFSRLDRMVKLICFLSSNINQCKCNYWGPSWESSKGFTYIPGTVGSSSDGNCIYSIDKGICCI